MTGVVIPFRPDVSMDTADGVLKNAEGIFKTLLLVGYDEEGRMRVFATQDIEDGANAVWLVEAFKHNLMNGDYMPCICDQD